MWETIQAPGRRRVAIVERAERAEYVAGAAGGERTASASGSARRMRWRRLAGVASLVLAGCGGEAGGGRVLPEESLPAGTQPAGSFPYDGPIPSRTPFRSAFPLDVPTALADYRLVGRGRRAPVGEQCVPIRLAEPSVGRWRIAESVSAPELEGPGRAQAAANRELLVGPPPAPKPDQQPAPKSSELAPSELRLEVQLLPRSLPRWRLVGSSSLNAARDSTWLEFVQSKADQVLKLKIECRWTDCLELVVAPHFQLTPEGSAVALTPASRQKAEQFTQFTHQRLTAQVQWLAAGGGGTANRFELKKQLEQQLKLVESARLRLERLATLQPALEQEGRVHIRLVSPATGEEVPLASWEPDA